MQERFEQELRIIKAAMVWVQDVGLIGDFSLDEYDADDDDNDGAGDGDGDGRGNGDDDNVVNDDDDVNG